jgi:hypothetical protein
MKILFINLLFITLLLAELKVGEQFPSLPLVNQYDKTINIPKEGEVILLISFEKDTSTAIQSFLEKQEEGFLSDNNMSYISDISSLPKFLVNIFVLPKLKKFDFNVALLYEKSLLTHKEGHLTIIHLKENRVVDKLFIESSRVDEFMVKPTFP